MKSKVFLIADTETVGLPPENFVYDLGYIIATRNDTLLERSFMIQEIATSPDKMLKAYFSTKIFTYYLDALNDDEIELRDWASVIEILRQDMKDYGVDVFCAYNLQFDMRALTATNNLLHYGHKVLEYKPDLLDLWTFACCGALNTRLYHDVARQQNEGDSWVSQAGNVRTTAERAYCFLTGELEFQEAHTGLQDARIETEILQRLLRKKKTIPYNRIASMPWKMAQNVDARLKF